MKGLLALRVRRLLVQPRTRWTLVAVVALATGLTAASLIHTVEEARDRWGTTRAVAVARRDLGAGETVDRGAVEVRELPESAVADSALSEIPIGAVVREPVAAGEPLVEDRMGPNGLTGVAALVPEGYRAIAVPVGPGGVPPVAIGDQVDVIAIVAGIPDIHGHGEGFPAIGEPAAPIVERATVVDVRDEAVSVAVPAIDVPSVAAALTQGVVLLTLAGA